MVVNEMLHGKKIYLRQIKMEDCTETYVTWLNDPDVNQYLETKWVEQNLGTVKEFVRYQRENNHSVLFAIILNKTGEHIGNIKIGPIHQHYRNADISYFIGNKEVWNKGLISEAISLVCGFGFSTLHLHKIKAGAYSVAIGSWKALERNGFKREGVFREQVYFENKYIDIYKYGLLSKEYEMMSRL